MGIVFLSVRNKTYIDAPAERCDGRANHRILIDIDNFFVLKNFQVSGTYVS